MNNFLLIDDDQMNNFVNKVILQKVFRGANIVPFEEPASALEFIRTNINPVDEHKFTIFLDINMPGISGWELLEEIIKIHPEVTHKLTIYMLSSSIDPRDVYKAEAHPHLAGFVSKPLTIELLERKFTLTK